MILVVSILSSICNVESTNQASLLGSVAVFSMSIVGLPDVLISLVVKEPWVAFVYLDLRWLGWV